MCTFFTLSNNFKSWWSLISFFIIFLFLIFFSDFMQISFKTILLFFQCTMQQNRKIFEIMLISQFQKENENYFIRKKSVSWFSNQLLHDSDKNVFLAAIAVSKKNFCLIKIIHQLLIHASIVVLQYQFCQ